ncbi:type II toxin-antitoxin system VapC family toxin [Rickettsia endosymbiont of Culicoides newsteadi]|uniref:type II toxin-antitoxin system VapC family toxin n=1 Tax=Rickettsia endosymbiont of Culicoides newsteadi TaxID=1961830 RepID=UPI000B9A9FD7|nr:type II toxin-antitoxin system VapC family toxin [Rickettsia endosymbiont of Culicoides newsteadi]OZG31261.1 toxin [Rickettsia endosymbiont of Culicoides newsteadi]
MRYLLDTNILSEFRKKSPNSQVISWLYQVAIESLYISYLTIGEIQKGIAKKRQIDLVASLSLERWQDILIKNYTARTIGIDSIDVCKCWGELLAIDATNQVDSLLAAQAIVHDMVLVTRNTKHFNKFGVKLLNPFEEFGFK